MCLPEPAFQPQPLDLSKAVEALAGGLKPKVEVVEDWGFFRNKGPRGKPVLNEKVDDNMPPVLGHQPVIKFGISLQKIIAAFLADALRIGGLGGEPPAKRFRRQFIIEHSNLPLYYMAQPRIPVKRSCTRP